MARVAIREFTTANPVYAGCTAEFWTVSAGVKTTTHATLYSAATGSSRLANPITLDSRGMGGPIYIEEPVICTVGGLTVASHDTGIIAPGPTLRVDQSTGKLQYSYDGAAWSDTGDYVFKHRGTWLTATGYYRNDTAIDSGNLYLCVTAHTSGTFATDLAAGKWALMVNGFLALSGGTLTGDLNLGAGVNVVFEGTTADAFETTLSGGEPTADRTLTLPDSSGTIGISAVAMPTQSASGSSVSFLDIPDGVQKITIGFSDVSVSGSTNIAIALGDSGGVEYSGYGGERFYAYAGGSTSYKTSVGSIYITDYNAGASAQWSGVAILVLVDADTNTWAVSSVMGRIDAGFGTVVASGSKALSSVLDRVVILSGGSFDGGKISLRYEF